MEDNKNKNIVIVLLVIIIVILAALCVLFATGILSLNLSKDNNDVTNNITTNTGDNSNDTEDKDDDLEKQLSLYEPIISEYKKFLASTDNNRDYTYVNMIDAVSPEEIATQRSLDFYYSLYDIDKDGNKEFLISYKLNGSYVVINIFTYINDSIKMVSEYWGRSRFADIYDNGIIVSEGSSGATENAYSFMDVQGNETVFYIILGEEAETIKTSSYEDTKYATIDEMIKDNTKSASKININTFDWKSIN